ncbi:hypothetical protein C2740_05560 [Polynucleobacter sp. MG-5-Ahmo-C2]|uniref:beta strand repeat-containing protein n=1 Tax=Polynucleobacter sp. MG-5-Ahmo-C2 TaxID=2081051 RepID=UPI001BFDC859|nr:hypothetical protein [Polynucleobacter sp. MG-5-Ahmo-C2]QWD97833.1 hypothetical protein C2740_05560 [Polynucleobacter sp. MG-5-Ahmo-C2]
MNNSIATLASNLQSAVNDVQARLVTTHTQIADGKRTLSTEESSVVARLSAQASSQSGVQSNITNATNIISVAQSGLSSIASILTQMQSLATQVSNGLYNGTDQTNLYNTFSKLNAEITKIAATTGINGNNLLSGNETLSVVSSSDGVNNKTISVQGIDIESLQADLNALSFAVANIDTTTISTVTGIDEGVGTYAQQSISFNAMANGDSATVGGLTFTANSDLTASEVANIFYQKIANSSYVSSYGSFGVSSFQGGYNLTSPGSGSSVTFTGATTGPMSSIAVGATLSARTPLSSSNVSGSFGSDSSAALIAVSFPPVVAGDTATVGGLTFTASRNLTPTELASIFAAKINSNTGSDYGSFSGSFVGSFSAVASSVLTLTGSSNGARTLDVSGRTANATITQASDVTTSVTGSSSTSGTNAQQLIQMRALSAGETETLGGLTLTANSNMTATEVAIAFLNKQQYNSNPPSSAGSFNGTSFSYSGQFSLNAYNITNGQLYAYASSSGSKDLIPASGSVTGASGNTSLSASDVTTLVTGTDSSAGAYAQQTVQFHDMFTGETVNLGGNLTFTATSFVNATTVANNFSARMSNSSSSPSGGYFSGYFYNYFTPGTISNGALSIRGTYYGPQSAISVSGSSGSITNSSAYLSSSNVNIVEAGSAGTEGVLARQTVSLNKLNAGDTATIGGLTLTAAADLTSTQVAEIFASKIAGANPDSSLGSFNSTSFIGGFTATSAINVLTLTGSTNGPKDNVTVSGAVTNRVALSSSNVNIVEAGSAGTEGVLARQTVSLNKLNAGDTATIGGLTLTAAADLTSTQVAEIFASKIAGANPDSSLGSFNSTSFIGGFTATSAINVLTLTGSTNGPKDNVTVSGAVTNRVALSSSNVNIVEAGSAGTEGVYAQQTVTLSAMNAGDYLTIGDLEFTAASSLTATQVAAIFASKITSGTDPSSSLGSFVGSTFSADFNATSSGDVLTLTGASYGPMDAVSVTGVISGEDNASTAITLINEFISHISATQASMTAASTNLTTAFDSSTALETSSQAAADEIQNIDLTALQADLQKLSVQQSLDFQVVSQLNSAASSLLSIFR